MSALAAQQVLCTAIKMYQIQINEATLLEPSQLNRMRLITLHCLLFVPVHVCLLQVRAVSTHPGRRA